MWADLYDHPQVGDTWGTQALQLMLRNLLDKQGKPYYGDDHEIDGVYGSGTTAAVKRIGNQQREYKKTHDTMACRFYDRFAGRSPCEVSYRPAKVKWIVQVPSWVSGEVQLVVKDTGRQIVAQYAQLDATALQEGWLSFDSSKLDQNASLVVELHSEGACVTPPVQIHTGNTSRWTRISLQAANRHPHFLSMRQPIQCRPMPLARRGIQER